MKTNYLPFLLLTFFYFITSCSNCDDDVTTPNPCTGDCFDTALASLTISTINDQPVNDCRPSDPDNCPIYCQDIPCIIDLEGTTQGLEGKCCVHIYAWVKDQSGTMTRHQNLIDLDGNGGWSVAVQIGSDQGPDIGETFEIFVTVSQDEVSATSIQSLSEIGYEKQSNIAVVESVGCFNPELVTEFKVLEFGGIEVVNNIVENVDCDTVHTGEACRPFVTGTSMGISSQVQDCGNSEPIRVIALVEGTDLLFKQGDNDVVDEFGEWSFQVQLGDTSMNLPLGMQFDLRFYATSVPFDSIPDVIDDDELLNYLPPINSKRVDLTVRVKP